MNEEDDIVVDTSNYYQDGTVSSVEELKDTPTVGEEEKQTTLPPPASLPEDEEWNRVDLNPQQQRRFNRIYRQMKQMQALEGQFVEDNRSLVARINEMQRELHELRSTRANDDLEFLKQQALANQDLAAYDKVSTELMDRKLAAKSPPEPIPEPEHHLPTAQEQITLDIADWVNEIDQTGAKVRPWASDESHPLFPQAYQFMQDVIAKYGNSSTVTHHDMMDMIDRRIATVAQRQQKLGANIPPVIPNVFSGADAPTIATATQPSNYGLSPEQQRVARMMFSRSKTPLKDYHEAIAAINK